MKLKPRNFYLNRNIVRYPCNYLKAGILPLPTKTGYSIQTKSSVFRSEMDLGINLVRRRTRNPITEFQLNFKFTGEQKKVFRIWLDDELNGGVEWFYLPLIVDDDIEVLKCQFVEIPGEESSFNLLRLKNNMAGIWESTGKIQTILSR